MIENDWINLKRAEQGCTRKQMIRKSLPCLEIQEMFWKAVLAFAKRNGNLKL